MPPVNQNNSNNNYRPAGASNIPTYYNPYGASSNGYVYNPNNPNIVSGNYAPQPNMYVKPTDEQIRAIKMYEIDKLIPKHEGHSLKGIEIRPRKVEFATQNNNEKAFVLVRKHWITNLNWITKNILYSFVPFIILFLASRFNWEFEFVNTTQGFIILLAYYSIIITNIFRDFLDWYFDPYIVTNERIIHYEFKPFTSYEVKEANLENIEDVKEESAGFIAGMFNYGDVTIRTASEEGDFKFEKVPNPTRVRDIISDLSKISRHINDRYS